MNEGATSTTAVQVSDPDGDSITLSLSSTPAAPFASLQGTNLVLEPGFAASGSYALVLTADDGQGNSTTSPVTVTVVEVNRPPVLGAVGAISVAEGATMNVSIPTSDPDGDAVTLSLNSPPGWASLSGTNLTLAPGFSSVGAVMLQLSLSDGRGGTATGQISVTVTDVNRPPVLVALSAVTMSAGQTTTVTAVASDADADMLTYQAATLPAWASLMGAVITFAPPAGTVDSRQLTVTVLDGRGGQDSKSFTLTVGLPPNQVPTLSALAQFDGTTNVTQPAGGSSTSTPHLEATLADPDSTSMKLEVEVRPIATPFSNVATSSSALGAGGAQRVVLTTLSPGSYTWQARAVDGQGGASSWTAFNGGGTGFIVTPGTINGTVSINAGAAATNSVSGNVTLTIAATATTPATLTEMCFSNDGTSWSGCAGPVTSQPWTLAAGDGQRTVFVRVKDSNNVTTVLSDSISRDTVGPVISALQINSGLAFTNSASASVSSAATDATSGVVLVEASNDGVTFSPVGASPVSWSLLGGEGTRTVTLRVTDLAGNSTTSSDTIIVDTTPPTGTVSIQFGAAWTKVAGVTLTFTPADANPVTSVCARESATAPAATDGCFGAIATTSFSLSSGDGTKTVYAWFRDAAGNVSLAAATDTIGLDSTPPTLSRPVIATGLFAGPTPGPGFTTGAGVVFNHDASDPGGSGLSQVCVGESPPYNCTAYATLPPFDLSGVPDEAVVTGFIQVVDAAGNVSALLSDDITIDTTGPLTSLVSIAGGAAFINTTSVQVSWSMVDVGAGNGSVQFSNDDFATFTTLGSLANPSAWVLLSGNGLKQVSVRGVDMLGNIGPVARDTITLDTSPPTAPGSPFLTPGHRVITVAQPTASDVGAAGIAGYLVGVSEVSGGPYRWTAGAVTFPYAITPLSNGATRFVVTRAIDRAGNLGAISVVSSATPYFPWRLELARPTSLPLNAAVFHNGRLFVGGAGELLLSGTSPDALTTRHDALRNVERLRTGGGYLWVQGVNGLSRSADDGATFFEHPNTAGERIWDVAYAGVALSNVWVAVGPSGRVGRATAPLGSPGEFVWSASPGGATYAAVARCAGSTTNCNGDVVVAVGDGVIGRSTNNGTTWSSVTVPTLSSTDFVDVVYLPGSSRMVAMTKVGATVGSHALAVSNDGGATWAAVSGSFAGASCLAAISATDVLVCLGAALVRVNVTTGVQTAQFTSPFALRAAAAWTDASGAAMVAVGQTGAVVSNRPGTTWADRSDTTLVGSGFTGVTTPSGTTAQWAITALGRVFRSASTPTTVSWSQVGTVSGGGNAIAYAGTSGTNTRLLAIGGSNVYLSDNGGATWTQQTVTGMAADDVWCRSYTSCTVLGHNSPSINIDHKLAHFDGTSWTVTTEATNLTQAYQIKTWTSVSLPRGVVIGDPGSSLYFSQTSSSWVSTNPYVSTLPAGNYDLVGVAHNGSGSTVLAVGLFLPTVGGTAGLVRRSTDYGATWSAMPNVPGARFLGVAFIGGTDWLAYTSSRVFKSTDNGSSWTALATPDWGGTGEVFSGISASSSTGVTLLYGGRTILRTDTGGE